MQEQRILQFVHDNEPNRPLFLTKALTPPLIPRFESPNPNSRVKSRRQRWPKVWPEQGKNQVSISWSKGQRFDSLGGCNLQPLRGDAFRWGLEVMQNIAVLRVCDPDPLTNLAKKAKMDKTNRLLMVRHAV